MKHIIKYPPLLLTLSVDKETRRQKTEAFSKLLAIIVLNVQILKT
jgi:hypothetical protein